MQIHDFPAWMLLSVSGESWLELTIKDISTSPSFHYIEGDNLELIYEET